MGPVDINFLEEKLSSLWHFDVQQEEVLDFSKDSDEYWVEVDSDEALGCEWCLFSVEEELVKLVLGGLLNSFFPELNLCEVIILKVLAEGGVEFLNILEFFTVLDGL